MTIPDLGRLFEAAATGDRAALARLADALEARRLADNRAGKHETSTVFAASATRPENYPPNLPFLPHRTTAVSQPGTVPVPEPMVKWSGSMDAAADVQVIIAQSVEAGWERLDRTEMSGIQVDRLERATAARLIMWSPTVPDIMMVSLPRMPPEAERAG